MYTYICIYNIYIETYKTQPGVPAPPPLGQGGGRAAVHSRFAAPGGRQRVAVRGAVERGAGAGAGGAVCRGGGAGEGRGAGGGGGAGGLVAARLALGRSAGVDALGGDGLRQLEALAGGLHAVFQREGPVLQGGGQGRMGDPLAPPLSPRPPAPPCLSWRVGGKGTHRPPYKPNAFVRRGRLGFIG